jgi:hypothetical protein
LRSESATVTNTDAQRKEMKMNARQWTGWAHITALALSMAWIHPASGQAFSSGGTGADGPLVVSGAQTITVRPGGVYNYTTLTINVNSTLTYVAGTDNSPVVILATGDVTINGTLTVGGTNGAGASNNPTVGGPGGPGGYAGGNGGTAPNVAAAGQGPGGGLPLFAFPGASQAGSYGAPDEFVALIPLFGGSGGAGGAFTNAQSGGGGGGAILVASSTRINIGSSGTIRANGGNNPSTTSVCVATSSSPGSGGAIRLVAPQILGGGTLRAIGGLPCAGGTPAGDGRIRLEAFALDFTGSAVPVPSTSLAPRAVSPAGNPALANVPTLAITSIGGAALPPSPAASYFVPDITLPLETTNPVPVAVTATNTPVGSPTAITVRLIPQSGTPTNVPAANHTGSFASSTASADLTFPVGRVSVVQAFAAMTLTGQTASLFPSIDGEPVERIMVAASAGEASTLSLVTKSGREVRVDQLRAEQQLQVARAWQILKETHVE